MSTVNRPLKVGFDMDGVLLYNPARLARPLIKFIKSNLLGIKKVTFFVPKSPIQTFMWDMLHKSSMWIAPGIKDIYQMVDDGLIEAYLITGRFEHLKKDTDKWIARINKNGHFKKCYYNQHAKQTHLYKEELINKYKLDIFIDDNWDIVKYLSSKLGNRTKVFWIYNLLDRSIPYKHKFPTLQKSVNQVMQITHNQK